MATVRHDAFDEALVANRRSVLEVAFERGICLQALGDGLLVGRCPFERTALGRSLLVERATGRFRCVSCWAAGDAAVFAQRLGALHEGVAQRAARPRRTSCVPSWALTPVAAGLD